MTAPRLSTRPGAAAAKLLLVVVAVALVATIAAAVQRHNTLRPQAPVTAFAAPIPVPATVMANLTNIPDSTWAHAGTTGAARPVVVAAADTVGGKPVLLYIGALYCPYCAAARWSVITALARFGTFSGLTLSASSSVDVYPSTPTFSFHNATYTSSYISLDAVEMQAAEPVGDSYPLLDTLTLAQRALIAKYDGPPYLSKASAGGIPFMLIGSRYMWSGSPYSPSLLAGDTQASVAATLAGGTGDAAPAILANANVIAATICTVDGHQPKSVCTAPEILLAMKGLPTKGP
ncbi:MAG TPA: DUF929 family protein [Gemmatimonadaceae bacterium]